MSIVNFFRRRIVWLLPAACLLQSLALAQQNSSDTLTRADLMTAARLIGLAFSGAEVDSMYDGVRANLREYGRMHAVPLDNSTGSTLWQLPLSPRQLHRLGQQAAPLPKRREPPAGIRLPANRDELAYYSIPQLAALIRSRQISSVDLTKFFLDRLQRHADSLYCLVSLTEEIAMEQARRADSLLARGVYRGLLHGIPYGLKDLFAVRGTRTSWGAEPYKNQVIGEDAAVYRKLRDAGAVLVGKLTLGALAMGDRWYGGQTRNPWNRQRGSSGSSAGSASATVAGLVPFAIGTETWGSIISPSATCGATGLRPTFGRVSRQGAMTLSWSLDKVGPICRSAEDAAIVLEAIQGADDADGLAGIPAFSWRPGGDIRRLRIGYARNYFDRLDSSRQEWEVLNTLRSLGAQIEPMVFPDDSLSWPFDIMGMVISAECAAAFDAFTRSDLDDRMTRQTRNDWPNIFRTARLIPAVEYINANRHRALLAQRVQQALEPYDVVISPTFGSGHQSAITNLTGHPAICMPTFFDPRTGLPASITFIGKLFGEAPLISLAHAYQQATEWNRRRPEGY